MCDVVRCVRMCIVRRLRDQMAQQEDAFLKFRADRDDERRGLEDTIEQLRSQVRFLVPG